MAQYSLSPQISDLGPSNNPPLMISSYRLKALLSIWSKFADFVDSSVRCICGISFNVATVYINCAYSVMMFGWQIDIAVLECRWKLGTSLHLAAMFQCTWRGRSHFELLMGMACGEHADVNNCHGMFYSAN